MGTTLEIDLDALRFGGEEGTTLGEAVVAEAARQVVGDGTLAREVRERVGMIADEEIRTALAPLIEKALTAAIQPTNSFGEKKGEPTTLREFVVERATRYLRDPDPDVGITRGGSSGPRPTRVQSFVAREVAAAVDRELKAALDEARAEVLAGVKEKAATIIAETITKMVVR